MSNPVASVVWPWREKNAGPSAPRKTGPSAAAVLLHSGIMAAVGAGLYWGLDRRAMGTAVGGLAAAVLASGFFVPPVFAAIERFGQRLGRWVGAGLTWGLLAPFYYLCFFPMHLGLKLKGKDPLCRRFPTAEPTYWTARKPVRDAAQYRKQF